MRKKASDFGQVHPRGLEAVGLGVGGAKTQVARKLEVGANLASLLKAKIKDYATIAFNDI